VHENHRRVANPQFFERSRTGLAWAGPGLHDVGAGLKPATYGRRKRRGEKFFAPTVIVDVELELIEALLSAKDGRLAGG